jgi:hypothetical protein
MGVNYTSYAAPRPDLGAAYEEYQDDPGFSQFIADAVCPRVATPVSSGAHSCITRESALMTASTRRTKGSYERVDIGAEDKTFATKEYGLEGPVDDRDRKFYASDFDLEAATLRQVMRRIKTAREVRVAAMLFNTTTWTGSTLYTDVSSAPWDTASSAVIAPVVAAKAKVRALTGMSPNTLIIGYAQMQNLLSNTGIIARFPGATVVTEAMIRANMGAIFGLQKLVVGGAMLNSANEGITASLSEIWGDDYAMVCLTCEPNAPINAPSVARTYVWTPENSQDLVVEMYREEQIRSEIVRARNDIEEKVLDASLGHLLKIDA